MSCNTETVEEAEINIPGLEQHGYHATKIIECGGSGRAILARDENDDEWVVKEISNTERHFNKAKKEVEVLKQMKHPYIVTYNKSFEEDRQLYIVMEHCKGGDLRNLIIQKKNDNKVFEEYEILDWFVQILLALDYVHNKMAILHGDIKPHNVFLTEEQYVNLGDFGCTRELDSQIGTASSVIGTELYYSPEVMQKKVCSKSDVWSLGWLLYDLCVPEHFGTENRCLMFYQCRLNGTTPNLPERYTSHLQDLLRELLIVDPDSRPSVTEILDKPYLEKKVKENKQLSERVKNKFINSVKQFDTIFDKHINALECAASEWNTITDKFETHHRRATTASLSGGVIGAAGGITALVGAILAPFTLGASLIVTGVGVGVGVTGGVTSAASNITKTVKQKSLRETLKNIEQQFTKECQPIIEILKEIRKVSQKIDKFAYFVNLSSFDMAQIGCRVGRNVGCAAEIIHICMLANVGRIASQAAKVTRAAAAVSGVISGVFVILDIIFIVKDSKEIHEMNTVTEETSPDEINSNVLKSIAEMRKAHKTFIDIISGIKTSKDSLKDISLE